MTIKMDENDEQRLKNIVEQAIKDTAVHVKNSTEKSNSNLVADIIRRMEPMIDASVEKSTAVYIPKYVNGKIDKLTVTVTEVKKHLEDQDVTLEEIQTEQSRVRVSLANQETSTAPLIDSRKTVLNVGRFIIWLGAIFGAVVALVLFLGYILKIVRCEIICSATTLQQ